MEFKYSKHANIRMAQRGIRMKWIESAILNPDVRMPTIQKARRRVMKKIKKKSLDVIYKPLSYNKILVIPAVCLTPEDKKVKG